VTAACRRRRRAGGGSKTSAKAYSIACCFACRKLAIVSWSGGPFAAMTRTATWRYVARSGRRDEKTPRA
jgi:hypothetical protein